MESLGVKLQQQSMAQIEVLPHRHPACYLKHISQAWKDSPCSPQDHWRWMSSRAADEMQVNQRKKKAKSCKTSAPNPVQNFLPPCSLRIDLINSSCWCLWGVKSEERHPWWPRASSELHPRDLIVLSNEIERGVYSAVLRSKCRPFQRAGLNSVFCWTFVRNVIIKLRIVLNRLDLSGLATIVYKFLPFPHHIDLCVNVHESDSSHWSRITAGVLRKRMMENLPELLYIFHGQISASVRTS